MANQLLTPTRPVAAATRPVLRHTGRSIRGIGLARLLLWQAVAVAGVAASVGLQPVQITVVTVCGLITVVTVGRFRRRWLDQWLVTGLRWLARRDEVTSGPDESLGPLPVLLPGLAFDTAEYRGRPPMGVVFDGSGWVAVLAVDFLDPLVRRPDTLPLGRVAELFEVDGPQLASVQMLVHQAGSGLRGNADVGPASAALTSPATLVWLVLRFDPVARPEPGNLRDTRPDAVHRVLRRFVARAAELLDGQDVRCRVLDEEGAKAALARVAAVGPPGVKLREGWRHWYAGTLTHTTYQVTGWSGTEPLADVLGLSTALPAVATSTAITLNGRHGDDVDLTVTIRVVTGSPESARACGTALTGAATAARVRLRRWDGEHRAGLVAALPLARPVPWTLARTFDRRVLPLDGSGGPAITTGPPLPLFTAMPNQPPVSVRLFAPRPVRAAFFCAPMVMQLVALRIAIAGAQVHVVTNRAEMWGPLVRLDRAAGVPIRLHSRGSTLPRTPDLRPVLVIDDIGGGGEGHRDSATCWHTSIALRPRVTAESARLLRSYEFVVLQGISVDTADRTVARSLPNNSAEWLPRLPPDAMAVLAGNRIEVADLAVTDWERQAFGIPARPRTGG